jgi:hypothetical protein
VLPPPGYVYGEELLDLSWRGACPRELPRPRVGLASPCASASARVVGRLVLPRRLRLEYSSLLSSKTAREFGQWRRQMDCSPLSPARLSSRKGVQEEGLQGRCS